MKFMPGYQLFEDTLYIDDIISQREHIHEVYFSFGDIPNGRNSITENTNLLPWEAQQKQLHDLKKLSDAGINLNLLLNGNCYGENSLSRVFLCKIGDIVDYLCNEFTLTSITTASPIIAKFVFDNFPSLEVRASVNMKIGTTEGMEYIAPYFDGYYMQREYNRDFDRIKLLKAWCDKHNKKLYMLANSGCLNNCSAQTFHDNLVSHEAGLAKMDNAYKFSGMCHEYLKNPENYKYLIDRTNFVRPEDMHLYDEYFTAAKLATRVSKNPSHILKSYINAKYSGDILRILEPAHSIYPYVLQNGDQLQIVKINTDIPMYESKDKEENNHADKQND